MILSMIGFAIADTLVKVMSATVSTAQILFFLISGAFVAFSLIAVFQGESLWDRRAFAPVLLMRYAAEVIGMIGMVTALALVPLSIVGAVTQATPILVAVGAVIFLNEKVSWRRWSAIAVGFVGVLLIVQPGASGFDVNVLWAVLAMVSLSVRDLSTRLVPDGMASSSLATFTMIAALPFAILWVMLEGEPLFPPDINWLLVGLMTSIGALGYLFLIYSLRMAEVSIVMPFRYSRILILMAFGIVFFDERPNLQMLIGAALIIASGIYMMWRERRANMDTARLRSQDASHE